MHPPAPSNWLWETANTMDIAVAPRQVASDPSNPAGTAYNASEQPATLPPANLLPANLLPTGLPQAKKPWLTTPPNQKASRPSNHAEVLLPEINGSNWPSAPQPPGRPLPGLQPVWKLLNPTPNTFADLATVPWQTTTNTIAYKIMPEKKMACGSDKPLTPARSTSLYTLSQLSTNTTMPAQTTHTNTPMQEASYTPPSPAHCSPISFPAELAQPHLKVC